VLETVDVGKQHLSLYESSAGIEAISQLRVLAEPLRGARVLHVNATPYGGGVAEILRSEIPLLRDLGLVADWKLITGDESFFSVTKAIHNGLQGSTRELTPADQETYLTHSARNAQLLEEEYDLIVVHDPQPLALLKLRGKGGSRWIWRCHIDTAEPNQGIWGFLRPYLEGYDAAVFTLGSFAPPDVPVERVEIIPPAIDPESPKNIELNPRTAERVLQWIGIEVDRPLITQVSRFDPWKDPLGVIAAYRLVREEVPDLQLALAGSMALDDPEGWEIYRQVQDAAKSDPNIHLFTNLTGVGNVEVNAFQRLSDVVIQKSIREGFGLVVSETLWKGTPVVAGRAGGIPLQMRGGGGGFLIDSVEECAEKTLRLLRHPEEGETLGARGRELVRERFLLTRLIADELRLYGALLGMHQPRTKVALAGLSGEERDPVCGMRLDPGEALEYEDRGHRYHFCSESCRQQFRVAPEYFLRATSFRS
jgi:trehalose synthase